MSEDIAIKVEGVSKEFKLPYDKATSLKSSLINFVRHKRDYELSKALDDISFEVKKGEFFGIVGRNGGGKSTLLKVISGIYTPTKGSVHVNGKLTPFIELGVGFNPELSGRENVYLNGALLGFNRAEMSVMYKDIVGFAELEKFMDQKLKNYSSGMQVRLAFSIAIRAKSDILVMDEVLAVGDASFQKKCFDVFRRLKKEGRTIILVTHDMGNVERFCERVLVIDQGKTLSITNPAEASSIYSRLNVENGLESVREDIANNKVVKHRYGDGGVTVESVKLTSEGKETDVISFGKSFHIEINLKRDKQHHKSPIVCGLAFHNEDDVKVAGPNTQQSKVDPLSNKLTFSVDSLIFGPGEYQLTLAIFDEGGINAYDFLERWVTFSVITDHAVNGLVDMGGSWK